MTKYFCVLLFAAVFKKTKGFDMSYCLTCANKDSKTGTCTYSGTCILKTLNIDPNYVPDFIASAKKIIAEEKKNVKKETEAEVVFNPFQRGNGCTLAGYTLQEILAHTR